MTPLMDEVFISNSDNTQSDPASLSSPDPLSLTGPNPEPTTDPEKSPQPQASQKPLIMKEPTYLGRPFVTRGDRTK